MISLQNAWIVLIFAVWRSLIWLNKNLLLFNFIDLSFANSDNLLEILVFISSAAALENVITRSWFIVIPSLRNNEATFSVKTAVFPVPALAVTKIEPFDSIAFFWAVVHFSISKEVSFLFYSPSLLYILYHISLIL